MADDALEPSTGHNELADQPKEMSVEQLKKLEQELLPLTESAPVSPEMKATNAMIGVVDEFGRLLLAFTLVTIVLVALAIALTPWLWVGVAAWIGCAAASLLVLHRRSRRPVTRAITK